MGRKKKKVMKPWCWYCNRDFDDDKILIQHQKAKHFKCHVCHKKLYTGPGLAIHCMQVHKESIDKIPNSLPNRGSTDIEVYGMEGVPDDDMKAHEAEVLGSDEPYLKAPRMDPSIPLPGGAPGMFPPMPMPGMPPMMGMPGMPGMGMPPMMPMMHGGMPGMPPPPGFPMMMPPRPTPPTLSAGPSLAFRPPPVAAPPLPADVEAQPAVPSTFPAYSATGGVVDAKSAAPVAAMLSAQGASTKIMHPEEDISLEERRASLPKYAVRLLRRAAAAPYLPPAVGGYTGGPNAYAPPVPPSRYGGAEAVHQVDPRY